MLTDDIYFVSWEDRELHWVTAQFNDHDEAEQFAEQLIRDGEAVHGQVEIR